MPEFKLILLRTIFIKILFNIYIHHKHEIEMPSILCFTYLLSCVNRIQISSPDQPPAPSLPPPLHTHIHHTLPK